VFKVGSRYDFEGEKYVCLGIYAKPSGANSFSKNLPWQEISEKQLLQLSGSLPSQG